MTYLKATLATATLAFAMATGTAVADQIAGNWKTKSGANAKIAKCGSSFCVTLTSGQYSGKQIGKMKPVGGGKYKGSIIDPAKNKKYSGKASVSGSTLSMSGCVLGGLICQSQKWKRL